MHGMKMTVSTTKLWHSKHESKLEIRSNNFNLQMRAINLNFCQIWSNWVTPRKLSSGVTVWKFRGWYERPDCNLNLLCGYYYLGNGGDGIRTQIKATRCCSNARPRPSRKRVWISKIHKEDTPKNIIIWRKNVHLWRSAFSGLLENCASFNASGGIIIW